MKTHFTEADLLETWYLKPGESMPVMMHLAECDACAAKYERLERKIREAAACPAEKDESFWIRQSSAVMRRVTASGGRRRAFVVPAAAAAVLVAFLAGGVVLQREPATAPAPQQPAQTATLQQTHATADESVPSDPWESQELEEFGPVVAWESWSTEPASGGKS